MKYRTLSLSSILSLLSLGVVTVHAQALADNLEAYYSFDTDATDSAGSYDGTVSGATHTEFGLLGGAYSFVEGSSNIAIGTPLPTGNAARSLSMWVKSTDTWPSLFRAGTTTTGNSFAVGISGDTTPNNGDEAIYVQRYTEDVLSSVTTFTTDWNHVVITYPGTTTWDMKFYINGVELTNTHFGVNSTLSTTTETQYIGVGYNPGLNGLIDEVGIWSRELSAAEVTSLYNSGTGFNPTAVPEPSLLTLLIGIICALFYAVRRQRS